jgi:hypothetical protein
MISGIHERERRKAKTHFANPTLFLPGFERLEQQLVEVEIGRRGALAKPPAELRRHWYQNTRLYIEVWSWDKVVRDASMRNAIFFQTLGI